MRISFRIQHYPLSRGRITRSTHSGSCESNATVPDVRARTINTMTSSARNIGKNELCSVGLSLVSARRRHIEHVRVASWNRQISGTPICPPGRDHVNCGMTHLHFAREIRRRIPSEIMVITPHASVRHECRGEKSDRRRGPPPSHGAGRSLRLPAHTESSDG